MTWQAAAKAVEAMLSLDSFGANQLAELFYALWQEVNLLGRC